MSGRDEELLSAYLDGELTAEERASVEQWLTDDIAARELLDELSEASGLVRSLPRHAAPADLCEAVLARVRALRPAAPLPAAPARPSRRRRATWVAASAAGLLLAVVLYRSWPSPDRLVVARVEAPATELRTAGDLDTDGLPARHGFTVANEDQPSDEFLAAFDASRPVDQPLEPTLHPAVLAQAEALLIQEELELALESGQTPVPGEALEQLGHFGDQVVIFRYRVVATQDMLDRVQVVLMQNGIVPIGEPAAESELLAGHLGDDQLQAIYLVAPTTNFTSAVDQITDLDAVTSVMTNTVAFVDDAGRRDSSERLVTPAGRVASLNRDLSVAEPESRDLNRNGVAAAPAPPTLSPLSVTATAESKSARGDDQQSRQSPSGRPLSLGVPATGTEAAEVSDRESMADAAYQVRVPARQKLVRELEELENSAPERPVTDDRSPESGPQSKSEKDVQWRSWEFVRSSPPPPARDWVRAVILFIPEKPE